MINSIHKACLAISIFALSLPVFAIERYELPSGQWRLISLPADPGAKNTVREVFADNITTNYDDNWVVYSYASQAGKYLRIGLDESLEQGVGYWIIQNSGETIWLDMPNESVPVSSPFKVILSPPKENESTGWNMVGYPFDKAKKFSDYRIKTSSGVCAEERCDPVKAEQNSIFHDEIWRYAENKYQMLEGDGLLNPWDGFWCATLENSRTVGPVELSIGEGPDLPGNWNLTFSDEFNGRSLDPDKWRLGQGSFLGMSDHGLAGNSGDKNTFVRNGNLEMIADKTPVTFGKEYDYSGGEISTFRKFKQQYGYFEARIKHDTIQGVWPAFWMMPDRGNHGIAEDRKESFIRFDINKTNQPVSKATLKLTPIVINNTQESSNVTIYKLLGNDWDESTITWNNKPKYDPAWLMQASINSDIREYEQGTPILLDVTDYVNSKITSSDNVGFVIADNFYKRNEVTFGSREAPNFWERPQLTIDGSDIYSSADAYVVDGAQKDNNYGSEPTLAIKDSWGRTSSIASGGMEFDIMESLGVWGERETQHALHWKVKKDEKEIYDAIPFRKEFDPTEDGYHTYGMYWQEGSVEFYIDGEMTEKYSNLRVGSISSYLLLSHQMGGWDGNTTIGNDFTSATMLVDYVRVWSGTKSE